MGKTKWTVKGTLCLTAFTAGVLYMVVPVKCQTSVFTNMLFHPSPADPAMYAVMKDTIKEPQQEFFFKNSDGNTLNGFLFRVPGAKKLVIYHHGNAGHIAHRMQSVVALLAMKTSVFIYDYRGFGKSEGTPSSAGLLNDGVAAFDFVRDRLGFDPKQIVNYGESIGAGPACEVAFKRDTGGLIVQSGISSLPEVGKSHFMFLRPYPDWLLPQPSMNNIEKVAKIHCPVAVIHGAKDQTIFPELARHVYNAANQPKQFCLLPDSNHNSVYSGRDLQEYIRGIRFVLDHDAEPNGKSALSAYRDPRETASRTSYPVQLR